MPIQQQLIELYETFFAKATPPNSLAVQLSCPLLLHIGPHWEHATRRLLIVGQETLSDWCFAPLDADTRGIMRRCTIWTNF